jgi:hypothetical protein
MEHGLALTVSASSIVISLMKHLVSFYYTLSVLVDELLVYCALEMYTYEDIWYEMEFV